MIPTKTNATLRTENRHAVIPNYTRKSLVPGSLFRRIKAKKENESSDHEQAW